MQEKTKLNWKAAFVLGLVSSTFSTIVSQLAGGRIGRDAFVDWMEVAAIPLRNAGMNFEPTAGIVAAGIAFHQWADLSWALFFFGALGAWTAHLGARALLLVAVPWALFTSFLEWSFLVPLLPFWQPTFTLRQPYWIGFLVHLASASIYPFFTLIRGHLATGRAQWTGFLKLWATLAIAGVAALAALALAGASQREPPHIGAAENYDRSYMAAMSVHHRQGMELARIAAEQAQDATLRARARLMFATQQGEISVMDNWARSWFGSGAGELDHAHSDMPGMLPRSELDRLSAASPQAVDAIFVELMSRHHEGAIVMAQDAIRQAGDPRLKLLSQSIAHQQCGDIALMHGAEGLAAVRVAWRSFLLSLTGEIDPARDCRAK